MARFQTEKYAVIKDNKIIRVYHTTQGLAGVKASLQYEKLISDEIRLFKDEQYSKGRDIREYDSKGQLLPVEVRIIEGYILCPEGKKVKDKQIVDKTVSEKIRDGELKVGPYEIYDEAKQIIRGKTREELYTPEEIAAQDEETLIQAEMRAIAIERLKAAGKIKK
jgi:hypothetical protein